VARQPHERERIGLDGGRRTTQLMRDSLGRQPVTPEILDFAQDPDHEVAATEVALFALQACLEADLCSPSSPFDYSFLPDRTALKRPALVAALARLPKPAWLNGRIAGQQCQIEAGPIADNPKAKFHYDLWHKYDSKRDSLFVMSPRDTPRAELDVLCTTQTAAIRVRLPAFQRYHRDYILLRPFSYGIWPARGLFRLVIPLSFKASAGLSHLVRITNPEEVHIELHYDS
jgi:hypothetical protein